MSVTLLVEADLLPDISQPEMDGLSKSVLAVGQADPVTKAIAEALSTIAMYVEPRLIKTDALNKIWRLLSIAWLYNRLSALPDKRKKEFDWCMSVLKDVRDGKFPNMMIDEELVAELGGSSWGSQSRQDLGLLTVTQSTSDDSTTGST